ncbi:MAG TPA: RIP metalloprotease RseP [Aestuariivirgaceae bacterium]|nr:RIP metalloprotease RseP [Aestuariivirgaceae bacterium]
MLVAFFDHLASFAFYALAFLFVLTILVFVHELGHFLVARWNGVKVHSFAVGFGREIAGITDKYGTRWKVGWLPLGGYVKFEGDANAASMPNREALTSGQKLEPGNFYGKSVGQRAAVVVAGPLANFLLAIVIFAVCFSVVGVPITEPRVDNVQPGSPAEVAGIKPGDYIRRLNGSTISSFDDIQRIVMPRAGENIAVEVERAGQLLRFNVVPESRAVDDGLGGKIRIGLMGVTHARESDQRYDRKGPVDALTLGVVETWRIIEGSLHFIRRVVTGKESASQLGGPLAIAQVSGKAASLGFYELMRIAAMLSVSIGLINLFPVPMLDGGHLLYYGVEAVRGRPLGANAQEWGFRVGFALVLALMLFATVNDLARVFSSVFGRG